IPIPKSKPSMMMYIKVAKTMIANQITDKSKCIFSTFTL
ncbi:hypothetical protein D049_0737B, partial [Vibrio parahaemolyticus VPTS-2010]